MIQTIYAEVPREKIIYLERAEFMNGQEQSFRDTLTASMSKYGFRDPVYCWYSSKNWGNKIKIIVGNNRMVVAKELNIPIVPAIITNFHADQFPLEGRLLKTDDEIRALWRVVIYPAIEGQMIMFPSWLSHGVEMNASKEKGEKGWRVSISFNFIQVDK